MGHISSAKVIYHLRKRFYWPRMQEDVEEYVNRNIVNKKPNRTLVEEQVSSLQTRSNYCHWISFTWRNLLEVMSISLCWSITLQDSLSAMQQRTRKPKLLLNASLTSLCYAMVSHIVFSMTKVQSSTTISSIS